MFRKTIVAGALLGLMIVAPAGAADLPTKKGPYLAPPPAFTWTGAYVGLQAGYGWGRDVTDEFFTNPWVFTGLTHPFKTSGYTFGGHIGANYQFGSIVTGVEADAEWSNLTGGFDDPAVLPFNPGGHGRTRLSGQISLRGRLGYAFDRFMIYGTGGFAGGQFRTTYTTWGLPSISETFSKFLTGGTFGGGVEYAFTDNLTARVEYRRTIFSGVQFDSLVAFPGFSGTQKPRYDTLRVGASYKF